MIGILFLCWISATNVLSQTVTWTVGTTVIRFNEDLKLTCSVSSDCCSSFSRIWENGTGTIILNTGATTFPNKYKEDWDNGNTGFSLIIKELQETDVGVDYDCQYRIGNDKHTLTQTATWEYQPRKLQECPMKWVNGRLTGKYHIEKSAPSPIVFAKFGETDVTSDLTLEGPTKIDMWFYNLTVSIDKETTCSNGELFTLGVITGTSTRYICHEENICTECWICGFQCVGWALVGTLLFIIIEPLLFLICFSFFQSSWFTRSYFCFTYDDETIGNYIRLYGKEYKKEMMKKALLKAVLVTSVIHTVLFGLFIPFAVGASTCPFCRGANEYYCMIFGFGIFIFFVAFYWTLKNLNCDELPTWRYGVYMCMTALIVLIPIPFLIERFQRGGNNQSTESGSSCWPPCSVGQDPNSPDPENAKSLLKKKRADKITEEKPVAVVISQPPKARHVMTDNTESTKYSTEKEKFSAGLDKGKTTRPLPSIGQPTDSPRPLPQMPQGNQQEKGGIQLQPLGDSTEKKKKKKRKKKAIKDSDEED